MSSVDGTADRPHLSDPERRDRLEELPPSAKLVARILDESGPLSRERLVEESLLPPATVRDALDRLREKRLVAARRAARGSDDLVYTLSAGPIR